jgi:predicted glycoside hydrolase/deacetylase ChbG (UPF0249 family)
MLIINADDWGGWRSATDAALSCYNQGAITSVSAMVFMEDSELAAELARGTGLDVGLHLNFNLGFTGKCPRPLVLAHEKICRFLRWNKHALLFYNPFLRGAFRAVYIAQVEEFVRLYGRPPSHFDGHQHMHLCTNILLDAIIPRGEKVRRSFSFWPGEKSILNRCYRGRIDWLLRMRYRVTDYFFSLGQCLRLDHVRRVLDLCPSSNVEVMTHPEHDFEYKALTSGEFVGATADLPKGSYSSL